VGGRDEPAIPLVIVRCPSLNKGFMLIKSRKLPTDGSRTLGSVILRAKRHQVSFHTVDITGEVFYEYELDLNKDQLMELLKNDEALGEMIPPETDEFLPSHKSYYVLLDWAEGGGVEIVFETTTPS